MLYKPQYCCQCAEKIDRAAWHIWTSRKFCEICETDYPAQKWTPLVFSLAGLAGLIFGFGSYLKSNERALTAETNKNVPLVVAKTAANQKNSQLSATNIVQNGNAYQNVSPPALQASNNAENSSDPGRAKNLRLQKGENSQSAARGAVYQCGAQTKKGTACTRRVKIAGKRCWQHEGLPAMPEAEKLAAAQ